MALPSSEKIHAVSYSRPEIRRQGYDSPDGIVVHALTFRRVNNLSGYRGSPTVLVSNMTGIAADVLERAMRLAGCG